jgi:hypothetical protein
MIWRQSSGLARAKASKAARLTRLSSDGRSAATDADRALPSIIESSPTSEPGPKIARMRSPPPAANTLALSRPSSTR